jgi:hypothetical protein
MRQARTGVGAAVGLLLLCGCGAPSTDEAAVQPTPTPTTVTVTATQRVTARATVRMTTTVTATRTVQPHPRTGVADLDVTKEFLAETGLPSSVIVEAKLRSTELDVLTTYPPEWGVPITCGDGRTRLAGVTVTVIRWRTRDMAVAKVCR